MFIVTDKDKLAKYHNAILYFAKNCKPGTTGKVKMAKLLYYMDFDHFGNYLESISGAEYFNRDLGPVTDDFWHQLDELQGNEIIKITKVKTRHPNDRELIEALVEPNLSVFNDQELETLKAVTKRWFDARGTDLKNASHEDLPWKITERNEHVPYALALHRSEEVFLNDN